MKKTLTLILAFSALMSAAQDPIQTNTKVNTVVVETKGDVTLRQGDKFAVDFDMEKRPFASNWNLNDSVLILDGTGDFLVTLEELNYLNILSSGDVVTENTFNGKDLSITFSSSGDSKLDLDYDHVYVTMTGRGDLDLRGRCNDLNVKHFGKGDLNTKRLEIGNKRITLDDASTSPEMRRLSDLMYELGENLEQLTDSVDWKSFERDMERWGESMEEWGRHMEEWGDQMERRMENDENHREEWDKPHQAPKSGNHFPEQKPKGTSKPKSLLFNAHWNGVDAGLNILLGPGASANFENGFAFLEQRPMRSWVFNFNIADVGIAFNRNHVAGLYTGIGLGWNNFSFNHPVRLYKGERHLEAEWIDESVESRVKKSKLGVLYVQAPLMIEVRPTRHFFLAAGVTAGLRVDTWTKIKFEDKSNEKRHGDYYVNPLKLDATFRAGGDDMGFFASFDLVPLFDTPTSHTLCFGFSLLF